MLVPRSFRCVVRTESDAPRWSVRAHLPLAALARAATAVDAELGAKAARVAAHLARTEADAAAFRGTLEVSRPVCAA